MARMLSVKFAMADGRPIEVSGDADAVESLLHQLGTLRSPSDAGSPARGHYGSIPRTHYDAIVLVLHRTRRALSREEIAVELTRNGFRIPTNLAQTLADTARTAKGKRYIEHPVRGLWALNEDGKSRAQELERIIANKEGGRG